MIKEICKGVVVMTIAIPTIVIGLNVVGRTMEKHANKSKQS